MDAKTKRTITWVLVGLIALGFLFAGSMKLIGPDSLADNMKSWGMPYWTRIPIGIVELMLGIGVLIPKTRRMAAIAIYGWMSVAIATHLQATPMQINMIGGPIMFGLLATFLLIVSARKAK